MANQSVSWKGCDKLNPITPTQVVCDNSITPRFAIFGVAKYQFGVSKYLTLGEVRIADVWQGLAMA